MSFIEAKQIIDPDLISSHIIDEKFDDKLIEQCDLFSTVSGGDVLKLFLESDIEDLKLKKLNNPQIFLLLLYNCGTNCKFL